MGEPLVSDDLLSKNPRVDKSLLADLERVVSELRSLGVALEGGYRIDHPFNASGGINSPFRQRPTVAFKTYLPRTPPKLNRPDA